MTEFPSTVEEFEEADSLAEYDGTVTSAITGLWKVQVREPPFEEPTISKEFLGTNVTPESIRNFVSSIRKELSGEEVRVLYFWKMRGVTKTGIKTRARIFTRSFNPVEPDVINAKVVGEGKDGKWRVITAVSL